MEKEYYEPESKDFNIRVNKKSEYEVIQRIESGI